MEQNTTERKRHQGFRSFYYGKQAMAEYLHTNKSMLLCTFGLAAATLCMSFCSSTTVQPPPSLALVPAIKHGFGQDEKKRRLQMQLATRLIYAILRLKG